jgi:hypothetical protein
MTAPVRIKQDEIERAVKAARNSAPDATIRLDLRNQWIDIILRDVANRPDAEEWTDDD